MNNRKRSGGQQEQGSRTGGAKEPPSPIAGQTSSHKARDTASRRCGPVPVSHIPGDSAESAGTHLRPSLLPGSKREGSTRRHPSLDPTPAAEHRSAGAARGPGPPGGDTEQPPPPRRGRMGAGKAAAGTAQHRPIPAPHAATIPVIPQRWRRRGVQGGYTGLCRPGVLKGQRASLGQEQRLCPGGARKAAPVPGGGAGAEGGAGAGCLPLPPQRSPPPLPHGGGSSPQPLCSAPGHVTRT
ncbi:translation initiation factor IF-2-like [Vidua chalybeata]|uniref:translation initiation factor IF-2-like n=1 Tax=Vidua chalybeata TaxID=81927 RepID=UPI0023A7B6EA|nr:translation initiation factor IF-2-like [Vidua chalybeata]